MQNLLKKTKRKKLSKQVQIGKYVTDLLRTGDLQPGDSLPALRKLAHEFDTSVTPVIQAMRELEAQGLVEMVHGQGCRVRSVSNQGDKVISKPVIDVLSIVEKFDSRRRKHTSAGLQLGILQTLGSTPDVKTTLTTIPPRDSEALENALQEIAKDRSNGIIIGRVGELKESHLARLNQIRSSGCHIVLFASHRAFETFDVVESDFVSGQRALTNHLLKKGHKELLRFRLSEKAYFEQKKQEGFRLALEEAGLPPERAEEWTLDNVDFTSGEQGIQQRIVQATGLLGIELSRRPISAVMAGNDARVPEIRTALRYLGRTDIEVTGYDGFWKELFDEVAPHFDADIMAAIPPSVDTHQVDCGARMAEIIIRRVHGELPDTPERIMVPQTLINT